MRLMWGTFSVTAFIVIGLGWLYITSAHAAGLL
jgi:hypothetical protein